MSLSEEEDEEEGEHKALTEETLRKHRVQRPPRRKLVDVTADKENNDSAIGSDLGNVTRSDNGSPKSTSSNSGSSSSKSSPDSGTGAVSRLEGVERALENVRISPLAEQQKK